MATLYRRSFVCVNTDFAANRSACRKLFRYRWCSTGRRADRDAGWCLRRRRARAAHQPWLRTSRRCIGATSPSSPGSSSSRRGMCCCARRRCAQRLPTVSRERRCPLTDRASSIGPSVPTRRCSITVATPPQWCRMGWTRMTCLSGPVGGQTLGRGAVIGDGTRAGGATQ